MNIQTSNHQTIRPEEYYQGSWPLVLAQYIGHSVKIIFPAIPYGIHP
ncbi:MAG: hypothetical protein WCP03_02900 [Candidatus Saccharibacteria bacterium]